MRPLAEGVLGGGKGQGMIFLHLGQDPRFGLMVPLPKKGLQIMLILKMFLLAIKWLQLLIFVDFMCLEYVEH